jgi:ligand-binding SRPBCC domain-containing protein
MSTQTQDQVAIERTTLINAPLEKVFAYYSDPSHLPEIWPSMLEVKDVERDENGHVKRFSFVYKMAGMKFSGNSEVTHCVLNERFVTDTKGNVESVFDTRFREVGGQTELHEIVHYRIPIPLIGKLAEPFLKKLNENELAVMHENLKARMESEV